MQQLQSARLRRHRRLSDPPRQSLSGATANSAAQEGLRRRRQHAGISGDTTSGALRRFDTAIGPDTKIAIVEFGTNDLRLRVPAAKKRANLNEIVRMLRARGRAVLVISLGSLDLSDVASANGVPYAQWKLPPHRYRARDGVHFNADGYALLVARLLPQVEAIRARNASLRALRAATV